MQPPGPYRSPASVTLCVVDRKVGMMNEFFGAVLVAVAAALLERLAVHLMHSLRGAMRPAIA